MMDFDVEIIVKVRGRKEHVVLREVKLDGVVTLNGADEQVETATVESVIRALEEAGPATRALVGHLPYMTDCKILYNPVFPVGS